MRENSSASVVASQPGSTCSGVSPNPGRARSRYHTRLVPSTHCAASGSHQRFGVSGGARRSSRSDRLPFMSSTTVAVLAAYMSLRPRRISSELFPEPWPPASSTL